MNKSVIWELVKINILNSNPQLLAQVKKKQSKRKDASFSAYKSILWQQGFMVVGFAVLYTVFFLGIDYSRSVGFFSMQLGIFTVMAILYGFTGFFSVFYDSKDTKLYLALPVKASEVFVAKVLSAQGMVLPFLMPNLTLLGVTYYQIGGLTLLPLALLSFAILWLLVNVVNLIMVHFIGTILTKSPRKTLISTILTTGASLISVGAMMYIQSQQVRSFDTDGFVEFPTIPVFVGFHYLVSKTLSLATLLHFALPILVMLGLIYYATKTVIPNYFNQMLVIDTISSKKSRKKSGKLPSNLKQALVKHHLATLNDSNLLVQSFLQPIIMGVALFPSFSQFMDGNSFSQIGVDYFGIFLLAGAILGSMFAGATTFIGVAMSLEKENYHFIKTLPINFKQFTIQKFWVVSAVQFLPPALLYLVLAIALLKVNPILALSFTIGNLVTAILVGQIFYWRDQRLLMLNWQNSNQLFGRGAGQWLIAGSIFATMILGTILFVIATILTNTIGPIYVSSGIFTLVLVLAAGLQYYLYKVYWKKL